MGGFAGGLPIPPELLAGQGVGPFGAPEAGKTGSATETGQMGRGPAVQGDIERATSALNQIMTMAREIQDIVGRVLPGSAGLVGLIAQAAEALHRDISQARQARGRQAPESRTQGGAGRSTPTEATPTPPLP